MLSILKIFLFLSVSTTYFCESHTPIVLWHGLLDTCCNTWGMGKVHKLLQQELPDTHIVSIKIGKTVFEDYLNGIMLHPDKQIDIVCKMIKEDPLLANGYHALGVSQGSQLLRGLVERCPEPRMKNLITMSGQHQGVYGLPTCDPVSNPKCNITRRMINYLVYLGIVQEMLVPSSYWHNPLNRHAYLRGNTYLADINNERYINQTYIKNLQSLENFVMVKYENDTVVLPKESAWFGFYKAGQAKEIEDLQESDLYIKDRLGLKQMEKNGQLHFLSNNWDHFDFDWDWFKENISDRFLK